MEKIVMTGLVSEGCIEYEDGGAAIIAEPYFTSTGIDENFFIRIQSYDKSIFGNPLAEGMGKKEKSKYGHKTMNELIGKKIRLTIEVL